jgi:hypothetical protein
MEKISLSETFLVGCDYALLVLGEELPDPMNPVAQAQLVGARRVLDILKTIGDPTQKPQERKARGLNYES